MSFPAIGVWILLAALKTTDFILLTLSGVAFVNMLMLVPLIPPIFLAYWTSASWWQIVAALLASSPTLKLGLCSDVLVYPSDTHLDISRFHRGILLALSITAPSS